MPRPRARLAVEPLEGRLAPAGNVFIAGYLNPSTTVQPKVREFAPDGTLVRTFDGAGTFTNDIAVAADGSLNQYSSQDGSASLLSWGRGATASPYNRPVPNWTASNYPYTDGLVTVGRYAFGTNHDRSSPSIKGGIRIDLDTGAVDRFAEGLEPSDIAAGPDGTIYLAVSGGVSRFDPETLASRGPVAIGGVQWAVRIAVDASGCLYTTSTTYGDTDYIFKYSPSGQLLATLRLSNRGFSTNVLVDMDFTADGELWTSFLGGTIARISPDFSGVIGSFDSRLMTPFLAPTRAAAPTSDAAFSIADASVAEGDSVGGTGALVFQVTRSGNLAREAKVGFRVMPAFPLTYGEISTYLAPVTFAPGESSKTVSLDVKGDTLAEGDETVQVTLVDPLGAGIGRGVATGTVVDDDPSSSPPDFPVLSFDSPTVTEGEAVTVTARLSRPFAAPFEFYYFADELTAKANQDFMSTSNFLTFAPGEIQKTITIQTVGDDEAEPDETFTLAFLDPDRDVVFAGGGRPTITIRDTPTPAPGVYVTGNDGPEGNAGLTPFTFQIRLSATPTRSVTASYRIEGIDAALQREFSPVTGAVTFQPGETVKTVTASVRGDQVYEEDGLLRLVIQSASVPILNDQAYASVQNDDLPPLATLSFSTATYAEPASNQMGISGTITLAARALRAPVIRFAVIGESATAGADFQPVASGTVAFVSVTDTTAYINITLFDDRITEGTETFRVVLLPDDSATPLYRVDAALSSARVTILDNEPTSGPRALPAARANLAVDTDLDGTYDRIEPATGTARVAYTNAAHTAPLLTFDVGSILASRTPVATLQFRADHATSGGVPVRVLGIAGGENPGLADANAAGRLLGTFIPEPTGNGSVSLDRAAIAALVGAGRWLTLRLDYGDGAGDSGLYLAGNGASTLSGADVVPRLIFDYAAPVARPDAFDITEDVISVLDILANDDSLFGGTPSVLTLGQLSRGSVYWDGFRLMYTPIANATGTDTFSYYLYYPGTDFRSEAATVTVRIAAVNDLPVASPASYSLLEDREYRGTFPVSDPDGPAAPRIEIVQPPAHGALQILTDGTFRYVPSKDYSGTDVFRYRASDSVGTGNTAEIRFQIENVTDGPTSTADVYTTDEDRTLVVPGPGILANDTSGDFPGPKEVESPASTFASHGVLTLRADGSFTFVPERNFSGDTTFRYWMMVPNPQVRDQFFLSNWSTVTIRVRPVNDAPVAANDAYSTNEDTPLTVPAKGVLANDRDVENSPLTAQVVAAPLHGKVTLDKTGKFVYVPAKDYFGSDRFTYRSFDGALWSNVATVALTIKPVNDAPVATNDAYSVAKNKPLTVPIKGVLANDRDAEGSALKAILVTPPPAAAGTLTLNADGSFTFKPKKNAQGTFTFTYKVTDGQLTSAPATVTLTVGAPTIRRLRRR